MGHVTWAHPIWRVALPEEKTWRCNGVWYSPWGESTARGEMSETRPGYPTLGLPEASTPHASILCPAFQLPKPIRCSFCLGYLDCILLFPTTKLSPLIKCAQKRPTANGTVPWREGSETSFTMLLRELFPLAPALVYTEQILPCFVVCPLQGTWPWYMAAVAFLSAGNSYISPADTFMDARAL